MPAAHSCITERGTLMPYGKQLAATGLATATIGGFAFTYPWLACIAAGTVILGGVAIRMAYKVSHR